MLKDDNENKNLKNGAFLLFRLIVKLNQVWERKIVTIFWLCYKTIFEVECVGMDQGCQVENLKGKIILNSLKIDIFNITNLIKRAKQFYMSKCSKLPNSKNCKRIGLSSILYVSSLSLP